MLILDNTVKLQVILGGAIATNQSTIVASYTELDSSGTPTPSVATQTTNSGTAVDVVGAPASGKQRLIKSFFLENADTAVIVVTVRLNASGTLTTCFVATLAVGDNLQYVDGSGWSVVDTNGQYRSSSAAPGRLIRAPQILTSASSTYTIPSGCTAIEIEMVGAGGGGGGASGTTASNSAVGGGGASGGYLRKYIANPQATAISYTNDATGGSAGANTGGTGGTGGDAVITISSVVYTAKGGLGGVGMTFGTAVAVALGGAGVVPTNGDINFPGNPGQPSIRQSGTVAVSGQGGSTILGQGGNSLITEAAGNTGGSYGGGGGGACGLGTTARAGGVGGPSVIIVTEYY